MTVPDPRADEVRTRLDRLEEAALYAERAAEELGGSIADLSRRLEALGLRIARLEQRLGQVESREPPPGANPATPGDDAAP